MILPFIIWRNKLWCYSFYSSICSPTYIWNHMNGRVLNTECLYANIDRSLFLHLLRVGYCFVLLYIPMHVCNAINMSVFIPIAYLQVVSLSTPYKWHYTNKYLPFLWEAIDDHLKTFCSRNIILGLIRFRGCPTSFHWVDIYGLFML